MVGAAFVHDWDGYVFEQSVRDFWDGYSPYTIAEQAPYYTFLNVQDPHPQWYAYPPLPLLAMSVTFLPEHFYPELPAVAERVLLKLPMIAGTLALAWVGGLWARHLGHTEVVRRRVELLLLFNPFLILVGPMWGMTDPALVALFLGGALRFQQGHHHQAGIFFSLSALVKPFPLLLAIPLVAYFLHTAGWRAVGRVLATGVPLAAAITLPFFLANPSAFWTQVVGVHLRRDPQGLTIWSVAPLSELSPEVIGAASLTLVAGSLLLLSLVAPRLHGRHAPLVLILATAVQLLLWNRIVNEQYLALVVAPLLLLLGLGILREPLSVRTARFTPLLFGIITILQGFHFLTFIPPDIALAVFGKPVDVVAYQTRQTFDWGFENPFPDYTPAIFVSLALLILAFVSLRHVAACLPRPSGPRHPRPVFSGPTAASVFGCLAVLLLGFTPLVSPAAVDGVPFDYSAPADRPLVGAFYYLWWNNAAHDPGIKYGNWLDASQYPEIGYYTNTRGVSRAHTQMMRENGIDVAIVSYHTGELDRYRGFQEEAARQGLLVAPLIELNEVYDQPQFRPVNETQRLVEYSAYRLTANTSKAIERFVESLEETLGQPNTYRVEGRPVVFFYDSYVSGIGYSDEERRALAAKLLEMKPLPSLREHFGDPALQPTVDDLLRHYPSTRNYLYHVKNQTAFWREAHLELHRAFWTQLRTTLEATVGPLYLVSGDAFNERAGFEAGTIKSLVDLSVFDGSFIYSPSFTWGNNTQDPFERNFARWEDRNVWLTSFSNGVGRFSAFGVAPSYDDTVKRKNGFVIPPFYGDQSTYGRSWESTLRHPPDLVVLATFNEFFEGSSVEPSLEYGTRFLNETRVFRERLADRPAPAQRILALVHERLSRVNPDPKYSETDDPHWWGLGLIAAAARVHPGSEIVAVDGLETGLPQSQPRPSLLLLDGGRDDYSNQSLDPGLLDRLRAWVAAGVPTVVFGREVAPPLRDLVPAACREGAAPPIGYAAAATNERGGLHAGDRLVPGSGTLWLERGDERTVVGIKCEGVAIAYTTLKPWGPMRDWEATSVSDPACLSVVLTAFHPNVVEGRTESCVAQPAPPHPSP